MFKFFNISITVSNQDRDANELLRKATEKKNVGAINEAIELLKKAYIEIARTTVDYPIETFLRLPLYLQAAGRSNEAWEEFNKLLKNGYPNQNRVKELIPMVESHIYDKMRLFLHRQKEYNKAVTYGIFSMISYALGLYNQKRKEELNSYTETEFIKSNIAGLLKKAKKIDLLDQIARITETELKNLPNVTFEHFSNRINSVLNVDV